VENSVNEALAQLANCDILYISFWFDQWSDEVSYVKARCLKNGYRADEIQNMINSILEKQKSSGIWMVENQVVHIEFNKCK